MEQEKAEASVFLFFLFFLNLKYFSVIQQKCLIIGYSGLDVKIQLKSRDMEITV